MRKFLAPFLVVLLSGCSVWGGKTFQCPNSNADGATCMSARQLYEATHTTDRVSPNYRDGKPIDQAASVDASQGSDTAGSSSTIAGSSSSATQSKYSYLPPIPEADAPLPVRMPAKVMRIRIFPWEDGQRDLNTGGFVFTEIEGRQWTLGDEQVSRVQGNVISPLAMPKGSSPGAQNASPLSMPQSPAGARNQTPAQAAGVAAGQPSAASPSSGAKSQPLQQGSPTPLRTP